jgi:hypothetical protein
MLPRNSRIITDTSAAPMTVHRELRRCSHERAGIGLEQLAWRTGLLAKGGGRVARSHAINRTQALVIGFFIGYLPMQRREATLRAEADAQQKGLPRMAVMRVGRGGDQNGDATAPSVPGSG